MNEQLDAILKEVLLVHEYQDTDTPEELESWTSITHIELIARIEETFHVFIDAWEVAGMDSIGNIKTVLRKLGVDC